MSNGPAIWSRFAPNSGGPLFGLLSLFLSHFRGWDVEMRASPSNIARKYRQSNRYCNIISQRLNP